MKRFPYILCIVFPVFVWACHTSRQTIGEARENRVHSIDRDLHVVIDSLCRNEWSGLTESSSEKIIERLHPDFKSDCPTKLFAT